MQRNADPSRPNHRDAGFTLLEILVALVVFGILMAGLTQAIRFGLTAWQRQSDTIATSGDIDAVDRTLRRLIEQMDPGTEQDRPNVVGSTTSFQFTSVLPISADLPTRRADVRLLLQDDKLILRWTPHLHAHRLGPPPTPQTVALLDGVKRLSISYWPQPPRGAWLSSWSDHDVPALVRIRIEFGDENRHWPDIIAATMRRRELD
jgi:general secretion pathway protein J